MQILVFRLNDLYFGMSTENILEISKSHQTTPIPNSPQWVHGLLNIRGEVLTLINLYSLLKIDAFDKEDCYNNTIIVQSDSNNIALMVDEVIGVRDVSEEEIQTNTESDGTHVQTLVTLYDQVVNIIELKNLFQEIEG